MWLVSPRNKGRESSLWGKLNAEQSWVKLAKTQNFWNGRKFWHLDIFHKTNSDKKLYGQHWHTVFPKGDLHCSGPSRKPIQFLAISSKATRNSKVRVFEKDCHVDCYRAGVATGKEIRKLQDPYPQDSPHGTAALEPPDPGSLESPQFQAPSFVLGL